MTALYDGAPAVVRLSSGVDLVAIVYEDDEDDRLILECPLVVVFNHMDPDEHNRLSVEITYRKWMPLTDCNTFPLWNDEILVHAPLAEQLAVFYSKWARSTYGGDQSAVHEEVIEEPILEQRPLVLPLDEELPGTDDTREDKMRAYLDWYLQNFIPKGQPN